MLSAARPLWCTASPVTALLEAAEHMLVVMLHAGGCEAGRLQLQAESPEGFRCMHLQDDVQRCRLARLRSV